MWLQFGPAKAGPEEGTLEQVPWGALLAGRQSNSCIPCPATPGDSSVPLLARDTEPASPWDSKDRNLPRVGKGEGMAALKAVRVGMAKGLLH